MGANYQIVTDSSSDLPVEYLQQEDILSIPLSFSIDGAEYYSGEMALEEFYQKIRSGSFPKTSRVNVGEAVAFLEPLLQKGKDILYIGFSSGMSGTISSVRSAAAELLEQYPARKISIVDSLSVSLGQGLLVFFTNQIKRAGASLEQASRWAKDHTQHLVHFITASDMVHLHRGGRISKATSIVGSLLGIRPIITLEQGKPKVIGSKRGAKASLDCLVEYAGKAVKKIAKNTCYITHADCEKDALYVREQLKLKLGVQNFLIGCTGPVLATHTGPNAVALFLMEEDASDKSK